MKWFSIASQNQNQSSNYKLTNHKKCKQLREPIKVFQLKVITCNQYQAQENAHVHLMISFGFASH